MLPAQPGANSGDHGAPEREWAYPGGVGNLSAHRGTRTMIAALGLALVYCVNGCGASADTETSRRFQAAEDAFASATTAEDYLRAAALYQEILDSGFASGAVLYNQGNAFIRAGQRGRAIAAYRQAHRYRPRDPFLDANLRSARGNSALPVTRTSALEYVLFWQQWISYPEKFALTTLGLVCMAVVGVAMSFTDGQRLLRRVLLILLVLTSLLALSTSFDWYRYAQVQNGVVVAEETIARKGNAESYEPAFTQPVVEGTEFVVVETRGNWLEIRVPSVGVGWIPDSAGVVY